MKRNTCQVCQICEREGRGGARVCESLEKAGCQVHVRDETDDDDRDDDDDIDDDGDDDDDDGDDDGNDGW